MPEIRWEFYPLVAQHELARTWLTMQRNLQLAPATIDAYGRNLNDYLAFCSKHSLLPETLTREALALYVQDLASRPNPRGTKMVSIGSGCGLSRATMQQRITVIRLYHDYLIEKQIRLDNPVGRGSYVAGKGVSTNRRGLLPSQHKLPWIPSDEEWQEVLRALREERLRNQVMLLLAYDGALRREEVVTLELADFDVAYRQIRVRAEHAKNGAERVVGYSVPPKAPLAQSRLWPAVSLRISAQLCRSPFARHVVQNRGGASTACWCSTVYDAHPTPFAPHAFSEGTPGPTPDRHLRGSQIAPNDDAF